MNFSKNWRLTILSKVSLSKKVQENKENQNNGKNTEKNRFTSTSAHAIFITKKIDTLYKQIDKPFNEQIESLKQALDHGIRNKVQAIEKYQFIMSYKLKRPVKTKEAGIIIQNELFWLDASPVGVIFEKKN